MNFLQAKNRKITKTTSEARRNRSENRTFCCSPELYRYRQIAFKYFLQKCKRYTLFSKTKIINQLSTKNRLFCFPNILNDTAKQNGHRLIIYCFT